MEMINFNSLKYRSHGNMMINFIRKSEQYISNDDTIYELKPLGDISLYNIKDSLLVLTRTNRPRVELVNTIKPINTRTIKSSSAMPRYKKNNISYIAGIIRGGKY